MRGVASAVCLLFALSVSAAGFSRSQDFHLPTDAERALASDDGSPAIVLDWIRFDDDVDSSDAEYVRIKVLSDEGRKYADVELPYVSAYPVFGRVTDISARTIHADGTIVPFHGKVYDKVVYNSLRARAFVLADVEPGSILEYRFIRRGTPGVQADTRWELQREIPMLHAKLTLRPNRSSGNTTSFRYLGKPPVLSADRDRYELEIDHVPAFEQEAFAPAEERLKPYVAFGRASQSEIRRSRVQTESFITTNTQTLRIANEVPQSLTTVDRRADLRLDGDALAGSVTVTYSGTRPIEDELRTWLPNGSVVTLERLDTKTKDVVASFAVRLPNVISMAGTKTLVPLSIFTLAERNPFASSTRTHPIDFERAQRIHDEVHITMPAAILSVPESTEVNAGALTYKSEISRNGNEVTFNRTVDLSAVLIDRCHYDAVRDFFGAVATADRRPVVIEGSYGGTGEAPILHRNATPAVVLFDSTEVSVDGDALVTHRKRLMKILTDAGRALAVVNVTLDRDTQLRKLRAWSVTGGVETNATERDATEGAAFGDVYDDVRVKMLRIPGVRAGSVVGYETEVRQRSSSMETTWRFQGDLPIVETHFMLRLPRDVHYDARWFQHEPVARDADGSWTLRDVPAIDSEPRRPSTRALAGHLAVRIGPRPHRTWSDVARWIHALVEPRTASSPEIAAKARALGSLRAIAEFVQRDIRYVAVEIGIGGYQPHPAADVFANRYGDCKDKVTLMRAMLRDAGIESHYVLTNTTPGAVDLQWASRGVFNHAIIAVRVSPSELVYFDPTSSVPFGDLPQNLQNNRALLVDDDNGEIVELPAALPAANQLRRRASLQLDENGTLRGEVEETRRGSLAASMRGMLRPLTIADRVHTIETAVSNHVTDFTASEMIIENLDDNDRDLVIRYKIEARGYATRTAGMLIVRPRVLGEKADAIVGASRRSYAYVTDGPSLDTDDFEITLPESFRLDELPPSVSESKDFVRYISSARVRDHTLVFHREYEMRALSIAAPQVGELSRVFARIMADERASAVFVK